ncbi:MAG: cytochrome c maturation protein CcmE [Ferrimicrobium sp.]
MTTYDERPPEEWKTIKGHSKSRTKMVRSLVVVFVILAALGYVLYKGATSALEYYVTVRQANSNRATLGGSTFRMEGVVVPGTITPTRVGVDFVIRSGSAEDRVIEYGNPPQLFQPNIAVIIGGHFQGNVFVSDLIMVKHSSNYVPQPQGSNSSHPANG